MKNTKKLKEFILLPGLGQLVLSGARPLIGILLGLLAGAGLIALSGVNPLDAYAALLKGAVGSPQSIANVFVRASPLLIAGVGVAIGIKAGVWNIGAEGYMYAGAIGAAAVGLIPLPVPPIVHILLALLAAMVISVIWGIGPAYLRAYRGVNEVVTTIMMNYVAIFFVSWLVHEPQPLAEPGSFFPMSKIIVPTVKLPILMSGTSLHPGFIIGILACILFFLVIQFTPFGFRTRMLGANPEAARYAGVNVKKQIVFALLIGALMGGVAGAFEILGLKMRVFMDFVAGVGYEAVAVALLDDLQEVSSLNVGHGSHTEIVKHKDVGFGELLHEASITAIAFSQSHLVKELWRADVKGAVSFAAGLVGQGAGDKGFPRPRGSGNCLLYTSDAADDLLCVDLGGRRLIKKKK